MKKILTAILVCCCTLASFAQQDVQYTQYMYNPLLYNPAYAGSREALSCLGLYRYQWAGIDGAPRDIFLSVHSPIASHMAVGLYLENDKIGIHNRFNVYGSYAYHIPIQENAKLSLGLQAGISAYSSDWSLLSSDDIVDSNDPAVNATTIQKKIAPNFGLGAYYYAKNFFVGAAVPRLLKGNIDNLQQLSKQERHYFMSGGYAHTFSDKFTLRPTVLLKAATHSPVEVDLNLSALLFNSFWIGAGYHTQDGMNLHTAYEFKNGLRIGYAYDITLSRLADYSNGSHEVMIGFDLRRKDSDGKTNENILSPRFF